VDAFVSNFCFRLTLAAMDIVGFASVRPDLYWDCRICIFIALEIGKLMSIGYVFENDYGIEADPKIGC
jgi:hypothetical protein